MPSTMASTVRHLARLCATLGRHKDTGRDRPRLSATASSTAATTATATATAASRFAISSSHAGGSAALASRHARAAKTVHKTHTVGAWPKQRRAGHLARRKLSHAHSLTRGVPTILAPLCRLAAPATTLSLTNALATALAAGLACAPVVGDPDAGVWFRRRRGAQSETSDRATSTRRGVVQHDPYPQRLLQNSRLCSGCTRSEPLQLASPVSNHSARYEYKWMV